MILGNDLAGGAVWANVTSPPVVTSRPVLSAEGDESGLKYPEVFPVCAVTRAQSRAATSNPPASVGKEAECVVSLPDLPPSVPREEWVKSQRADPSLSTLLECVLPGGEIRNVAHGYFLQNELLVWKWVPCEGDFVGEIRSLCLKSLVTWC